MVQINFAIRNTTSNNTLLDNLFLTANPLETSVDNDLL
jgi:hypothetical protein